MTNGLPRTLHRLLLLVLAAAGPAAASELNVERWLWNLDNTAQPSQFNTLQLTVANVSPEPFDDELVVFEADGTAPIRQPVYLPPGQRQRIFFDVYVADSTDRFLARWGSRTNQQIELSGPTLRGSDNGLPVVAIDDGSTIVPKQSGVAMLAAADFPPSAVTLPAGGLVLLDHMPRWQTAQQQALLDWVRLGGEVRVLNRADTPPQFTGELAVLGLPAASTEAGKTLGAGRILAIDRNLGQLPADELKALSRVKPQAAEAIDPAADLDSRYGRYGNHYTPDYSPSEGFFSSLSYMHRPDVNWPLIFTLFAVYVVVLIGGGLLASKLTRSWQKTYLTLLGTVAAFSLLFWQIGARGHDEQSLLTTVGVADVLDESRVRIHGWSDLFTTQSRSLTLRPGDDRAGLKPRENSGKLVGGTEPALVRSAPPFSSVTFEWQAIESLPAPRIVDARRERDGSISFGLDRKTTLGVYFITGEGETATTKGNAGTDPEVDEATRAAFDAAMRSVTGGVHVERCSRVSGDRYRIAAGEQPSYGKLLDPEFESLQYGDYSGRRQTRREQLDRSQGDLMLLATRGMLRRPQQPGRIDVLVFAAIDSPFVDGLSESAEAVEGRLIYRVPIWLSDLDDARDARDARDDFDD